MPFKHHARRRHKIPKSKYRVTNWSEYNESLRQRGDLTVWFDEDLVSEWRAPPSGKPGGQPVYSDTAIEICLTLRAVFSCRLRQTQGLVRSLMRLLKLPLPVPDFSTLSRRGTTLTICPDFGCMAGPITLIVDSTGLKVAGQAGWLEQKHGERKRRKTWRKLHLGLDPESGGIVTSSLTTEHVADPAALSNLLQKADSTVECFIADGAYDGQPVHDTIKEQCGPEVEIIIPPPVNAVSGSYAVRDAHIDRIRLKGRTAWQKETGYTRRSRVEAQIGRYKAVIGSGLYARKMETQTSETDIAIKVLNRMTRLGRAVFQRVS